MNNQNQDHQEEQDFTQNLQMGSGLTRYRSAPSSYFASLLSSSTQSDNLFRNDGDDDLDHLLNHRAVSPETQRIFSRFINSSTSDDKTQEKISSLLPNMPLDTQSQFEPQFAQSVKNETCAVLLQNTQQQHPQQTNDYSSAASHMTYHQGQVSEAAASGSFNSNPNFNTKIEGGLVGNSSLVRYNSSPAGFFNSINMDNEFAAMRDIGNYGGDNINNMINESESASSYTSRRFKTQMDVSSRTTSSSSMMKIDPISEIETNSNFGRFNDMDTWDDPELLSDSFPRGISDNRFSNTNTSDIDQNRRLTHHLSLPKTSSELSAVEKMFQDSVPCKIRAKRGCATHPRSIAERIRRTKISERMRKLQELGPNMDKQTNTSDMLDLAVDYIKDLQRQVKMLSDAKAKCTCSSDQKGVQK